jgi:hypothetical protein
MLLVGTEVGNIAVPVPVLVLAASVLLVLSPRL